MYGLSITLNPQGPRVPGIVLESLSYIVDAYYTEVNLLRQ